MKTLQEFRNSAVPMTATAFMNTYGVTDVTAPKVIVYADGFYIECDPNGRYSVVFNNGGINSVSRQEAEQYFWDNFAADEIVERKDYPTMFVDLVKRMCDAYKLPFNNGFDKACKYIESHIRNGHEDMISLSNFLSKLDHYNHLRNVSIIDEGTEIIANFMEDYKSFKAEGCHLEFDKLYKVTLAIRAHLGYSWTATMDEHFYFFGNGEANKYRSTDGSFIENMFSSIVKLLSNEFSKSE